MMDISERLKNEPVGKLFLKLAIPSVLAQLVSLLYNIVDRIYLGHIPGIGAVALTGVGLCMPIIVMINAFTMLIAQGGAPLASIALGEKNLKKAEKILGNCVCMLCMCSCILGVFFMITGQKFLMMFGASEETIVYALPYLKIYVLGNICVMGSLGLNMFITTQGFTRFSMIAVVIGAVCNIILDPILIFVFGMGVRGAAIATIISQAVVMIMALSFLSGEKTILKIKPGNFKIKKEIILPVIGLGMAPFIMQLTEAVLNISFNYSLQKYGGDIAVGAMTIAGTVMQMFWIPSGGIGQGAQPIISYNYGAKDKERLKQIVKLLFLVMESYFLIGWALIELFPQVVISAFNSSSRELIDTTVVALRIYIGSMGLFGLQSSVQQVFVSTGQAKASMFVACLRKVILLIPFIFLLPKFMENKVMAVFLAEPVSDIISVTTATCLFLFLFPRILKKMDET